MSVWGNAPKRQDDPLPDLVRELDQDAAENRRKRAYVVQLQGEIARAQADIETWSDIKRAAYGRVLGVVLNDD